MQLETSFINYAVAVQLGLQAWCLKEVVSLKVNVATLNNEHIEMKARLSKLSIAVIFAIGATLCFTGCSSTGGVGEALGNVLAVPGKILDKAADAVTATTTNVTTSVLSSGETVSTTNRIATLAPIVTKSENTAKTLADYLPAPWAQAAELALGGASGLLALLVRRKQRQLDGTNADLNNSMQDAASLSQQLAATIQGVENAVKNNVPVKQAIAKSAAKAGVADALNETVQATVS